VEDSNVEMIGSKEDKEARLKAAKGEPAWTGMGTTAGMWIWRIEKFKVVAWPKEEYGKFFSGDSYILLNSYVANPENPNKLAHDIHFWIGSDSSQDEYGTAAYKTVELDDFINGSTGSDPVQHREIEGHESPEFLALFPKGISFMKGGVDTGFRHVEPTSYKTRLLHVKGKKNCTVREVELSAKSLNKGDIFIIDAGLDLYEWIGSKAGIMEKQKAAEIVRALDDERGSKPNIQVYDEVSSPPGKVFWELLGGKCEIAAAVPDEAPITRPKKFFKVSDASGKLEMTKQPDGDIGKKASLKSEDVFILDVGDQIFVWTGKGASDAEKANGLGYATKYISDNKRPKHTAITCVKEGSESQSFLKHFPN
jgi:gelsolin